MGNSWLLTQHLSVQGQIKYKKEPSNPKGPDSSLTLPVTLQSNFSQVSGVTSGWCQREESGPELVLGGKIWDHSLLFVCMLPSPGCKWDMPTPNPCMAGGWRKKAGQRNTPSCNPRFEKLHSEWLRENTPVSTLQPIRFGPGANETQLTTMELL